jgi:hypothetical protein
MINLNKKIMKKYSVISFFLLLFCVTSKINAQRLKESDVPINVKSALAKKYPQAKNVTWEKENGNYEANWGGKSGEANAVQYTPAGDFVEIENAISVSTLPKSVTAYINEHYKGSKITEASRVTDAKGKQSFEAEVNGKDLVFDEKGNFVKSE